METTNLIKAFLALLFVVGLIGLLAGLARKYRLPEKLSGAGVRSGRLRIVESLYLDSKRRIVLLEHDKVQHLLLLGEHDTVIETNITAPVPDATSKTVS